MFKKIGKYLLSAALVFTSVFAVAGCGKDNDNNTTETGGGNSQTGGGSQSGGGAQQGGGSQQGGEQEEYPEYIGFLPTSYDTYRITFGDSDEYGETLTIPSTYNGKPVTEVMGGPDNDIVKHVIMPNTITLIDYNAFQNWTNLESITLSNQLTELKNGTFSGATKLKSVILPSSVTTIDENVFEDCTSLEYIVVPTSVTSFKWAFIGMTQDFKLLYQGTKTQWNNINRHSDWTLPNQWYPNSALYYYSETMPLYTNIYWHFNGQTPEVWEINYGNTVDNKTYNYLKTEVTITDEYWSMLQSAKEQSQLEALFGNDATQIEMVTTSNTKAEYEEKLSDFSSTAGSGLSVSFENGKAKLSQGGQSTSSLDYLEIDGVVYYKLSEKKAFTIDTANNQIYEEVSTEYNTVKHIYSLQAE